MGGLGIILATKIQDIVRPAAAARTLEVLIEIEPEMGVVVPDIDGKFQVALLSDMSKDLRRSMVGKLSKDVSVRFADNASLLGSRWLHAMPKDKTTRISDGSFCGATSPRRWSVPG